MKNDNVASLWKDYKDGLNDILKSKLTKIEKSIEEFESNGYQLERMNRPEANILSEIIGKGITYSTTVNYCCMLNKFLRIYEDKYNVKCEKVYANKNAKNYNLYYSEDELIDNIEEIVINQLNEFITEKSLNPVEIEEYKDSNLSGICIAILKWYGITTEEMTLIRLEDIHDNVITLKTREKILSDRAAYYINRYKNMKEIAHFWRYIVRNDLPNSGFLFRRESLKHNADELEPMTVELIKVIYHRFTKDTSIKKYISLSGAFSTITEKTTEPPRLVERVNEYIGSEKISDVNIKKYWISYLDGMN